ncbi:MAG: hypothetical protein ABW292_14940 [Vicinamibacterales bacterium]
MKILDLVAGWFGTFGDNELELVSTKSDPVKFRMGVQRQDGWTLNLGAISFNIVRDDGNHDEMAYIMGRIAANEQEGAIYATCWRAGAAQAEEVFYVDPHGMHVHVPLHAPNLDAEGGGAIGNELRAPGGVYWLAVQEDGNIVAYKNRVPHDYSTGVPYWSSGTVNP